MKTSLDLYREKIGAKYALEAFGYAGAHILWVGLSNAHGIAQLFDYDTEAGYFRELKNKRLAHEEADPARLVRLQDIFYYTGDRGKLMKLTVGV